MPAATEPQSAFALINDRLRGRLKYAISLGLLLGAALGYAGYRFAPVKYISSGNIHVASSGTAILRETPETAILQRYEGYRRTQELLVTSPRVLDRVQRDDEFKNLAIAGDANIDRILQKCVETTAEFNTELITVTFEADDAHTARVGVDAVLRAYEALYGSVNANDSLQSRISELRRSADRYRAQRDDKQREIDRIIEASDYGATDLTQILQAQLMQIETIKQGKQQIELMMVELPAEVAVEEVSAPVEIGEPTQSDLEAIDAALADLYRQREAKNIEIARMSRTVGPEHMRMREARKDLGVIEELIAVREETARARWIDFGGVAPVANASGDLSLMTRDQLERRLAALERQYEANQDEVKKLVQEQNRIQAKQRELTDINTWLDEILQTIEVYEIEKNAEFSGKIVIKDWGVPASYPARDRRRPMAMVGFVGGFGLSCALFFLLGTIDRRTYSASQLIQGPTGYRLLGVLPYLNTSGKDTELSETAAQCVHQIRNRIEAMRDPDRSTMIVVTSPYQGDGKTSLAMALGWSYAASGHRTLLMDCDLLGRNLTDQMGVTRHEGVKEALRDRHLTDHIVNLPIPNLSVLGAGMDGGFGPESIRRDDFAALCGELRQRFDIVIADTGPFIGSVELLPVTAASDGVVFSVRRGRSRSRLEECLADLDTISVPCLGVVLNCADRSDCNRYVSKSAISMRHMDESAATTNGNRAPRPARNALIKAMERNNTKSRN